MKKEIQALCNLQALDSQITSVTKSLSSLDSGSSLKQGLAQTEAILANRAAALHKSESDLKENELKLKNLESKKKDLEKKLYDGKTTNPKELSGIQQEIEMLDRNREKLDESILALYDTVERQKKLVQEAEERRQQFISRLEKVLAQQESQSKKLNAELARLNSERETAAKEVPVELLRKYDSIKARNAGIGIAPVKDDRCGACHTRLTPYLQRLLKLDNEFQFCESCGRFLYPENN